MVVLQFIFHMLPRPVIIERYIYIYNRVEVVYILDSNKVSSQRLESLNFLSSLKPIVTTTIYLYKNTISFS